MKLILFMISIILFCISTSVPAYAEKAKKETTINKISKEDMEIIEVLEILKLMDLMKDYNLVKDLEILIEEDTNEDNN